jgi:hypothetical protein
MNFPKAIATTLPPKIPILLTAWSIRSCYARTPSVKGVLWNWRNRFGSRSNSLKRQDLEWHTPNSTRNSVKTFHKNCYAFCPEICHGTVSFTKGWLKNYKWKTTMRFNLLLALLFAMVSAKGQSLAFKDIINVAYEEYHLADYIGHQDTFYHTQDLWNWQFFDQGRDSTSQFKLRRLAGAIDFSTILKRKSDWV